MTIQEMKKRKQEIGITYKEIALRSGVSISTVRKIFEGHTKTPRTNTLLALEKVLETGPDLSYEPAGKYRKPGNIGEPPGAYGTAVREWKQQGDYTLEDYYAIPDEQRVELIDGVIYDMAAPAVIHQIILGELHLQFTECASLHKGSCHVFISPCDVQLDKDNRTMLQPDLFVLCGKVDLRAKSIYGAPDLVLEILSESTRSKDMLLKNYKYEKAQVREYWMVDPKTRRVMVYNYEKMDKAPEIYSFTDEIPVGISGGSCRINFKKIYDRIADYYDE